MTFKILPPLRLLLHGFSFIPLNLTAIICIGIATRWSFLCLSSQEKSKSFELESCVLVRDDLFIAQCMFQGMIIYPWGPPSYEGYSKEMLTCGIVLYALPDVSVQ